MRAKEFVSESKGKISKNHQYASRGLHKFTDSTFDKLYMLNRVMMAVASTDGKIRPDVAEESWVGKFNTAHPYTQQESDMLNMAYDVVGIPKKVDINNGDLTSQELPSSNTNSPIKPFKGYKK